MTVRTNSFEVKDLECIDNSGDSDKKINSYKCCLKKLKIETTFSFKDIVQEIRKPESEDANAKGDCATLMTIPRIALLEPAVMFSPRPVSELDAAAVKLQKVYKSYRTRRNLADCAVVVEELWWKALDFAALKRSSVSFFNVEKPETAVSRWARARTRAAKVGKGLSKDEKAQKLALQHWLEAIDPRHRYGHNLQFYYDVWFQSQSSQPFFYWLDAGDGREVNLKKCPRANLQHQCIKYLGPRERKSYEVIIDNGKLMYKQSGLFVDTVEGSKWIFVLSTSRTLYVGQKNRGAFQHSSFLAGGAIIAAGRLVAQGGILEAIWAYSGHYRPTEEHFQEIISFLEEHSVDLSNVKKCPTDDDWPPNAKPTVDLSTAKQANNRDNRDVDGPTREQATSTMLQTDKQTDDIKLDQPLFDLAAKQLSCKWTSGAGPRIGCVRDYPPELQFLALEQVNLSPRVANGSVSKYGPIPSPRPSHKVQLSPRLAYMGLPSPRNHIPAASPRNHIPAASPRNPIPAASPRNLIPVASPRNCIPTASPRNLIRAAN